MVSLREALIQAAEYTRTYPSKIPMGCWGLDKYDKPTTRLEAVVKG